MTRVSRFNIFAQLSKCVLCVNEQKLVGGRRLCMNYQWSHNSCCCLQVWSVFLLPVCISVCLSGFLAAHGEGSFLETDHTATGQISLDTLSFTAGQTEEKICRGSCAITPEEDLCIISSPFLFKSRFSHISQPFSSLRFEMGHCPNHSTIKDVKMWKLKNKRTDDCVTKFKSDSVSMLL